MNDRMQQNPDSNGEERRSRGPVRHAVASWLRVSRWRMVAAVGLAVAVAGGGVFVGRSYLGGAMTEQVKEEEKRLSQQEAYEFVVEHLDNVIAHIRKVYKDYEDHGYLKIKSVEVIPESVKESGFSKNPMMWSRGVITYNYYINGNRDYEVIGDSMIGPYYEGTLIENVSDPNVPGKVVGTGATISARFHEIQEVWDEEITRPAREARARVMAKEAAYIEAHKDRVLKFARERYSGDDRVGRVDWVEIDPRTSGNLQFPEGTYVFDFFINGDKELKVFDCVMVGLEYPGFLRKREDDGQPLWIAAEGQVDGSVLKPGDILDYMISEEWRRERWDVDSM